MGVAADELLIGLRRYRFQSHVVFYTEDGNSHPRRVSRKANFAARSFRVSPCRTCAGRIDETPCRWDARPIPMGGNSGVIKWPTRCPMP
jgi:hypothetical protein